jgi:hypothetical protein
MAVDQEKPIEIPIDMQLGIYDSVQPTSLPVGGYLLKKNAYMNKMGSNAKRPGSKVVTTNALAATIPYLTVYEFPNSVAVGAAPTLSAVAGTATLPAATYFVRYTYVTDSGETAASAEASLAIALGQTLRIVIPVIPYHANSIKIYISTVTNTETLRYSVTALTTDVTAPLPAAGVAYPTTSTTSFTSELLASSGTSLYSFYNADFHAATMTNAFASSDIYTVGFTNTALASILFITDGGAIKKYNGSAVSLIAPAPDDAAPAPANGMASVNLLNPIYCWVYNGYLFVSNGKDVAYFSKLYEFDYFPVTFYRRWVRNNDYMTGPGVSYGNVMLIPMRRGWGVMTGSNDGSFVGNIFLNSVSGNIAPRAIAKLTYPDGSQTVAYLSDDGVYEIYDTGFIDSSGGGSRNYATRSLMKDKFDFSDIGFTEAEKIGASAYFDSILNMYILTIYRGTNKYAIVYDVRNHEWTGKWENIKAESTVRWKDTLYYAGETKLLHAYDATLATDYDNLARSTGTIVDWDCYLDVIMMENTGFQSYLDYLIVNAKNYPTSSTIDITIVGTSDTSVYEDAVQSSYAAWDVSLWDFCVLVNADFSTIVGAPSRTLIKKKAYFFQVRLQNNRDELVELYKMKFIGRSSGN